MILILLSWLYILFLGAIIGVSINKTIGLKNQDSMITLFFGFFGVTLAAGFWAIPFAIDSTFHIALLSLIVILSILFRSDFVLYWKNVISEIKTLSVFLKLILFVISILILAQCASPPFLVDNESYYIQTIKWLNEYGFVKGLVNIHPFLGQTSGWHILQSAFNFSFIYASFNDLSGLALLFGNVYAIFKLNAYITKRESSKLNLVFGLFPLWNIFFFQFISTPSPDVAIYVLTFILMHQFIICYSHYNKQTFFAVVLLAFFIALIKLTGLVFCILPIILYTRHFILTRISTSILVFLGLLTLLLFAVKNLIITGNLLFPLQGIESLKTSWSLPNAIEVYFANYMQPYGYHMDPKMNAEASFALKLKHWLMAPLPHGYFNSLMLVLLAVIPFLIRKLKHKQAFWMIYGLAILNMILLFTSSPQYRFFFPFILCFSLLLVSLVVMHKKSIKVVLVLCTLLAAIPMFFKTNNRHLTENKYHEVSSQFSMDYLIHPFKNSKYTEAYKTIQLEETIIYIPTQADFFWGTGDIPLPAINQKQLDYFRTYFNVIPQQRTNALKDGFYALELK